MRLGLSLAVVLLAGSLGAFAGLQFTQPSGSAAGYSPGLVQTSAVTNDESFNEGWELIESLGIYGWKSLKLSVMQNYDRLMRSWDAPPPSLTKGV
jgi:hypothetical protein